jgi:ATP-dependent helicase/DNAse subunit B
LTRLQRERVLRRILPQTRLKVIDRSAGSPGFPNAVWRLISELERALVSPERFSGALRSWAVRDPRRYRYSEDLAALYDTYAGELSRLECVDADLYAWRSVDALAAAPNVWGSAPVFVYGFDDLTPAERYALETLSGAARAEVAVSLTWERSRAALMARADAVQALRDQAAEVIELPALADHYAAQSGPALHHLERHLFERESPARLNPGAAIRLLEAGGERAEAELVAAEVLALLQAGVPASQIVVVYRSLRRIGPLVERVFEASGIPIALHRDVPFTHTALGRGVLSLVKCALDGGRASAADLLSYLRTPGVLDQPETADEVEATVRRAGIRTAAQALAKSPLRLPELETLRDARDPLQELSRQARQLFSSHRRGLAPVLDLREELDGRALSVLLRSLGELEELRESLDGEELVDVLEHLAVPVEYSPTGEAVLIAEPLEIRASRFRVVFVCGLQESEFPQSGHPDPLLGDDLRRELAAIAPSNGDGVPVHLHPHEDALQQERYLFYASVTRATEQVVMSYRSSDEDGGIELPSPFIADVADLLDAGWMARRRRRLLADVVWAPQEAPTAREQARARALAVDGQACGPGTPRNGRRAYTLGEEALGHVRHRRVVSAGALESYAECPMKWLVDRELQLDPLRPEPAGMIRGQVVHRVLEELYRRLGAAVTEATLAQAQSAAGELLREYADPVGASQPTAIRAGLVRAIQADIDRFLALEASSGADWPPRGLELRFGFEDEDGEVDSLPALELAGGVRVRGMIDRVDIEPPAGDDADTRRRAIVRDYKTGATRPEYQGARWAIDQQLQVPLYMLAVRELLSLDPVAGFYQPVGGDDLRPRGVFVEGTPLGSEVLRTDARPSEDVHKELEAAAARAAELAAGLRAGRLEPCPDTCSRGGCAYPGICRAG